MAGSSSAPALVATFVLFVTPMFDSTCEDWGGTVMC